MHEVPFGTGSLSFAVPAGLVVETAVEPDLPVQPVADAARAALASPVGSLPLDRKARGAYDAVLAVPDATRAFPVGEVLPMLLDAFEKAGIPPARVTVLVATGLHRGTTDAERTAILGAAAGRGATVVDHDARGALRDLGRGAGGAPLWISERVAAAGFVASLGVVEPHQYAGFSGGWKTVGIGCAGEETIAFTHSPRFLDSPKCRPGLVDGNPFQDLVKDMGRKARCRFALNIVPGRDGGAVAAAAGDPGVVHRVLLTRAREACAVTVSEPADVVVAGVGAPKDANLYQASRAATNLVLGAFDAVKEGGTVVIPAPCPEGIGAGEGEKRFAEALRRGWQAVLAEKTRTFLAGEQRAWALAKVLEKRKVVIAGSSLSAGDLGALGLGAAATVDEALAAAAAAGARRVLVVPRALRALPSGPGGKR